VTKHAQAALPAECCGILVGTPTQILSAVPSANLADDPRRQFLVDPKTHIEARRDARLRGLSVIGFYHSHPQSAPVPSQTDLENASYPDHLYLIVRPRAEGSEARLFRLESAQFVEVALRR
jgi:proteasome lid subunit RPN8/RPN11